MSVINVLSEDKPDGLEMSMLPAIREIRQNGPGRLRRAALKALVHLAGERSLDPGDLAVLRRLIAIKQLRDRPQPLGACWDYWLAVRGGDQRGILRVLGLDRTTPATYPLGQVLIDHLAHGGPDDELTYRHVFVSPEVNGWTVVSGPSCDPERPEVGRWVRELSAVYGDAQAYYHGGQGDGDAWLVGVSGDIVRRVHTEDLGSSEGEPLPVERRILAELGLTGPPERLDDEGSDQHDFFFECTAPRVAQSLSFDPVWTGFPTDPEVRGRAVLAWPSTDDDVSVLTGCYGVYL
ncbi:hypothetical protein QLQ12_16660 [Actinoplanes sp. NEAU-A12]|uniref:HEAT repeat domain-containing protein n=1 Tax=Actinoplanes sandaracinus TaxID=3045177 RepID=A0ABT6WKH5_9ACTN|nr:hypothetical protein [Actinoplanes sandaracinus]MDI6100238.1 hypothetical protein [Actinoplanes sandaracinus]